MSCADPLSETNHLAGTTPHWPRFADVAASPGCSGRTHPGGHVTVGVLALDPVTRSMAVVLHPRFGRWMQPGGHVEPGDASLAHAAARELVEETGLVVDPAAGTVVQVATFDDVPCAGAVTTHFDVRVAFVVDRSDLVCSPESLEVAWAPLGCLPAPHDADLADLAALGAALLDG